MKPIGLKAQLYHLSLLFALIVVKLLLLFENTQVYCYKYLVLFPNRGYYFLTLHFKYIAEYGLCHMLEGLKNKARLLKTEVYAIYLAYKGPKSSLVCTYLCGMRGRICF